MSFSSSWWWWWEWQWQWQTFWFDSDHAIIVVNNGVFGLATV